MENFSSPRNASTLFEFRWDLLVPVIPGILVCFPGIFLNIFVAVVSNKEVAGWNYQWFIFNLAVLDTLYCVLTCSIQVYYRLHSPYPTWDCKVSNLIYGTLSLSSLVSLPLLSFNRYVTLCFPKRATRLFTPRKIFMMCMLTNFAVPSFQVVVWILQNFDYPESICTMDTTDTVKTPAVQILNYLVLFLIVLSFLFGAFCAFKFYKKLKLHERNVLSNLQKQRLEQNRELMRLALAQMLLPIFSQIPVVCVGVAGRFLFISDFVFELFHLLFVANAAINPLLTITGVKPYRLAFQNLLKGFWKKGKCGSTNQDGNNDVPLVNLDPNPGIGNGSDTGQ